MKKSIFKQASLLACVAAAAVSIAAAQTSPAGTAAKPQSTKSSATASKSGTAAKPAAKAATSAPLALKDDKSRTSYALGVNVGTTFHHQGIVLDPNVFLRGLRDAMAGGKLALTDDQIRATLTQLQQTVQAHEEVQMKQEGDANLKEGAAFLAANKSKDGVMTTPSGLQYKILKQGDGPKPTLNDTVVCNYRGTLIDGTEFDSSYKRGQPARFPVSGVIKGWTEALQMMPVGSKWQLFIPSDLGYGARGMGGPIGPNATLIFEVELVSIAGK